jgi:hypothetical protein
MNTRSRGSLAAISVFALAALFIPPGAGATSVTEIDDMSTVGEARMRVLFWDVYDARLLAPRGNYREDQPFALSLTYLRALDGEQIAARSIEEMRKQGLEDESRLQSWYADLVQIIPDVDASDEIVGLAAVDGSTRFYLDGELIGRVDDAAFTRAFFSIWLGEATSEPQLREQLLGVR